MNMPFVYGYCVYNGSGIGGLVRAGREGEHSARPIVFRKNYIAFANPLRNRIRLVEAWAHGLGAGAHDVRGNGRQLVRAAIAGAQEDARMASRAVLLAALREIREHAAVRHVVPVDGNEERPFRAAGVYAWGAVAALAGRVQAEIPPAA